MYFQSIMVIDTKVKNQQDKNRYTLNSFKFPYKSYLCRNHFLMPENAIIKGEKESFFKGRPYHAYADYFRLKFGKRYRKIPVDAGFTCPDRNGKRETGGCIYCNNEAFSPSYCKNSKNIADQLKLGMQFNRNKYGQDTFNIAYIQTYTGTYARLTELIEKYSAALSVEGISGIAISTRPDCLNDSILDFLGQLAEKYYVVIEIGIESCYNATLEKINRGHSFETTMESLYRLNKRKLTVCGHIILGLPGESREMILEEARKLSLLPVQILKIHQLQILKNTRLAEDFRKNPEKYHLLSLDEYISLVTAFLEHLSPEIWIERLCAEVPQKYLEISPWKSLSAEKINHLIESYMRQNKTWQGKKYRCNDKINND